jgi:hypothetical protein
MQRTKRGLRISGWLSIAASACLAQAAAAQGERLTVEVGECVNLPTPEQRLACFEAQVEAARGASPAAPAATAPAASSAAPAPAPSAAPAATSAAPAAAPAASAAAPATTTIEVPASTGTAPPEFGFRERPEEPEAEAPPEVRARVTELRETVPNAFLITLDNGQVWRQTRAEPYKTLRVGQEVRIYFSRWRSYRLDSPQMSGFLQVERVR